MNALIAVEPCQIGSAVVPAVNGRELHGFLGIATPYKDWSARRIRDYRFHPGEDFCAFLRESSGGRKLKDHAFSLGMARVLAMLERSDRGEQARRYFLECERAALPAALPAEPAPPAPSFDALALQVAEAVAAKLTQRALLIQALPAPAAVADANLVRKASAFDQLTAQRGDACSLRSAAKQLGLPPMRFIDWLARMKWLFRGANGWEAFQHRIEAGYLEHRFHVVKHGEGFDRAHAQVRVTVRGLAKLAELLRTEFDAPTADVGRAPRRQRRQQTHNAGKGGRAA